MSHVERPVAPRIRRRRRSPLRKFYRYALLTIIIAAIFGGAVFAYMFCTSGTVRDTLGVLVTRSDSPSKAFPGKDEVNLLIMGRDHDRDRQGRILDTNGRTDAIMLAHVDFRNKHVNILSIPRDTLVRVPGYRGKRRINSANALGGPELAQETVANFLGVTPDDYVMVNFEGFAKAIDSLGGLKINVDKQLDYDDNWGNLHIHLSPGRHHLNGYQAMGFVRYRKSNDGCGDSDFVRIGRQQEFLRALKSKLMTPGGVLKVPHALDAIRGDMDGTLTSAQMICLARFMKSLPPGHGIQMATVPADEGSRIYVRPDREATRELVSRLFYSNDTTPKTP